MAEFESCLLWSSRPGNELPVLMVVANNSYGISTKHADQHAMKEIATRGEPHGIRYETVPDGNDPVAMWNAVDRAISAGALTADLAPAGKAITTRAAADAVLAGL